MVAGRFLQGMAAAALAPSALSLLVHNTEDAAARAKAVSLWSTSAMLATLVGSAVGGLLADHWGWRSIFALNVPIGIVVYVVGAKTIDESADPEHTALDPAGQLLGALWLATSSWGLIEGGRRGWATPPTITALGLAFAAFAAFLAVEMRQERPMLPLALVGDREVAKTCLIAFVIGFAPVSVYVFIPIYMQQVEGHSAATTGVLLMPMALANGVASLVARGWIAQRGPHSPMIVGTALAAAGMIPILLLRPGSGYPLIVVLLVVLGASLGISMPATNNAAIAAVPPHRSGLATGLLSAVRQTGYLLGIAVHGAVLAAVASSGATSARAGHATGADFTAGLHLIAAVSGILCLLAASAGRSGWAVTRTSKPGLFVAYIRAVPAS